MNIFNYQKIGLYLSQVLINSITKIFQSRLFLVILVALSLSGCINYDLGIKFNHTNNGELVQHIKLSKQLSGFSGDYIFEWLKTLERRAKNLQGSVNHISAQETIIKIPFTNGTELQEKFSVFFPNQKNQNNQKNQDKNTQELADISANLISTDNNFLFLSRHHLIYDLDLRSLAALSIKEENVTTANNSLINLDFSLQTPWGVKSIEKTDNSLQPEKNGNQVVWKLKPGQLNHIEAVFWLPNILGIGTLIIVLFVGIGFYLKGYLGESKTTDKNLIVNQEPQ